MTDRTFTVASRNGTCEDADLLATLALVEAALTDGWCVTVRPVIPLGPADSVAPESDDADAVRQWRADAMHNHPSWPRG